MESGTARRGVRPRRPRWAWACLVLGTVLLVASGGALLGSSVLLHRYTDAIARENLLGDAARNGSGSAVSGPLNILLVGSDYRRNPKNRGKLWRADTVMVMHVPRSHDRAYLISFARDMLVDIPAADNGDWPGGRDKLNAAFVHGGNGAEGYRLLARTMSDLMGIRFDSGAVIDFYGFIKVVQVLGGVRLCIETPKGKDRFTSIHPPYRTFTRGCRHYNGHQALDYIRQRKQFADGDHARMRHQQQFLRALLQQARDKGLHRDLGQLDRVIRATGSSVTLDESIPVASLAFTLRGIRPEDLTAIRVPVTGRRGNAWYAELVPPAPSLFEAVREESVGRWAAEHPRYVTSLT